MAFFRTINFTEPLPSIEGDGVMLRTPQMTDFERMGGAARGEPRFPHAVGADLAGRRSDPRRVPAPHQALCRGSADRPGLRLPDRPQFRRRAGRRPDAGQYPPRRRPGRQPRLLDGPAVRAPRLHDGGGARRHSVRLRHAAAASPRSGLHSDQCRLDPAFGENRLRRAKAMRGNICASTASGRITCSMPGLKDAAKRLNHNASLPRRACGGG